MVANFYWKLLHKKPYAHANIIWNFHIFFESQEIQAYKELNNLPNDPQILSWN